MNKNIPIILLALLLSFGSALSAQSPCVDSSLINPDVACPAVYDPVCGCDGQTYGNACEAANFFGITSFVPGECNSGGGTACYCEHEFEVDLEGSQLHAGFDFGDIDPPFFFYVEWSLNNGEVTGTGLDFVHLIQQPGRHVLCATYPTGDFTDETCTVCKVIEVSTPACIDPEVIDTNIFCPAVYDPVCGCDGVTYDNECVAYNHHGVTSWTAGVCPNECINPMQIDSSMGCIEIYDPVCGCDSVTYSNECYAINYGGVKSWTKGACCLSDSSEPAKLPINLSITPNPVPESALVQVSGATPQRAWLFDVHGKQYWQENQPQSTFQLHVQHLPTGLYSLQVQTNRGMATKKLVIE